MCVLAGWNRGGGEGGAGRRQRAQPAEHPGCHHGEFWEGHIPAGSHRALGIPREESECKMVFWMNSPPPRPSQVSAELGDVEGGCEMCA